MMRQSGRRARTGLSVKRWLERTWEQMRHHPRLESYRQDLEALLQESQDAATGDQRRNRAMQAVTWTATSVQSIPPTALPFLLPPILMVMVQGIARLHGVRRSPRQLALEVLGAVGGGFVLRLLFRFRPILLRLSAANSYPLVLAVGRFAIWYYAGNQQAPAESVQNRLLQELERATPALPPPAKSGARRTGT